MDPDDRVRLPTGRTNARLYGRGQGPRCEGDDDKRCKGDRCLTPGSLAVTNTYAIDLRGTELAQHTVDYQFRQHVLDGNSV